MISWFVTGTGTDVGKTAVATALLLGAKDRGWHTLGYKPIESGCETTPNGLFGADETTLNQAASQKTPTTYRFPQPIAPSVAAEIAGTSIDLAAIDNQVARLQRETPDFLLVEGAGGLLVPISPTKTIADLAVLLQLPVLIVAANELGAMNHTLLTVEAVQTRGLSALGVVLTDTTPGSAPDQWHNTEEIARHCDVPVFSFAYCPTQDILTTEGSRLLTSLLADTKLSE